MDVCVHVWLRISCTCAVFESYNKIQQPSINPKRNWIKRRLSFSWKERKKERIYAALKYFKISYYLLYRLQLISHLLLLSSLPQFYCVAEGKWRAWIYFDKPIFFFFFILIFYQISFKNGFKPNYNVHTRFQTKFYLWPDDTWTHTLCSLVIARIVSRLICWLQFRNEKEGTRKKSRWMN